MAENLQSLISINSTEESAKKIIQTSEDFAKFYSPSEKATKTKSTGKFTEYMICILTSRIPSGWQMDP